MRDRVASHLLRIALSASLLAVAASGTVKAEAAQPPDPLFEWNVPSRYSGATDARGKVIETQPYEVRRGPWKVYLRVRESACVPGAEHHWSVRPRGVAKLEELGRCRFVMRVPREGPYLVRLHTTVPGKKGELEDLEPSHRIVVVRDFLIVAIGDSVGSGEGVPEATSLFARAPWQSVRCHRSSRAGFARAARQIEGDDGKSSVTFVHLACSGAAVRVGLLEPYAGVVRPRDEPPLEPQIDAVERLASERRIDALLISAGANDVDFAGIATFCAFFDSSEDCFARPLPRRFGGDGARTVRENLAAAHATLREQYPRLARRIAAIEPPPERVYLAEYFDSTHDENGQLCEEFLGKIGLAEVEQARGRVLRPLSATVAAAARENGWTLVEGIAPAFRRHGYCAGRHAWVSTLGDSLQDLGGLADRHRGTLHPNAQGHEVIGAFVAAALERDLFPDRAFPVRAFPQAKDDGDDDGPSTWLVVALVLGLVAALVAVAIFLGPAIAAMVLGAGVLLFLLWLGRESATPLVLGFLLGALLLLALRRDKRGDRSRAGDLIVAAAGPVLSLLRTLRPLLLPLLVVVAIGAAQQPLVVQVLVCAALVLIAWYGIVDPEQKRSEAEAERSEAEKDQVRWKRNLGLKVFLHGLVAIGLGILVVSAVRLVVDFVNPYFETIGNFASGLLLVALLIWAVAIVLRLVSYATTPLRALLAFDLGLALVVLLMAFGIVPANEAVRDAWPPLAIVFGVAALALLAIEIVREVIAGARGEGASRESRTSPKANKPSPLPRRRWQSRVAGAGFSAAAVAAMVLATSTVWGLVDAAEKGEPLTPPDEEVADILTLAESGGGEAGMELARRYAPVLAFGAEERWAPMAVEPYVAAATLTGPPGTKPRKVESLAGLRCAEFGHSSCYRLSIECDGGKRLGRTGAARELCEGTAREEGRLYRSGAVYVRVLEKGKVPEGEPRGAFAAVGPYADRLRTLVQYWYFYPYNEWRAPLFAGLLRQVHESDWEGVTIGFDGDDRPLFVGYSAHCGGSWRPWRDVEATTRLPGPRTHPLVAVALGSHANYPLASEERSPDWASCSKKLPSGTATALSYASNIRDRTEYGWLWYPSPRGWREARAGEPPMSFPGYWGADGEILLRNFQAHLLATEAAPKTPSLQSAWREPVRTIFCGSYEPRRCK